SDDPIDMAVGFSNFDASADMTSRLIKKGYRRIALVGGDFENNDQAQDRYRGFMATMTAGGRSVPAEFVISVPTPTTMESGRDALLYLMKLSPRPDAIMFHSEIPAHGAIMACLSENISVPGTVAIAGFG